MQERWHSLSTSWSGNCTTNAPPPVAIVTLLPASYTRSSRPFAITLIPNIPLSNPWSRPAGACRNRHMIWGNYSHHPYSREWNYCHHPSHCKRIKGNKQQPNKHTTLYRTTGKQIQPPWIATSPHAPTSLSPNRVILSLSLAQIMPQLHL